MIDRPGYLEQIQFQFEVHPVVAVLGARQCGKTTLAGMYGDRLAGQPVIRFDLEDPTHLARLESPKLAPSPRSWSGISPPLDFPSHPGH